MSTDSSTPRSLGAVMSSEAGFESDSVGPPLRVSGFIALVLALLSGFSIVAIPMVLTAIAAVLFGIYAQRSSPTKELPVGTTAARVAIVLAFLFGSWGAARYQFKQHTLGSQAEYFARQFVRVASNGNDIYAQELQKSYRNRYLKTMPLEVHYEQERKRREEQNQRALAEGGTPAPEGDNTTVEDLQKYSPDHEWLLWRPVRVYHRYGRQMAEVILADSDAEKPYRLMVVLEYLVHPEKGTGEWYVETCLPYYERIVAETIL